MYENLVGVFKPNGHEEITVLKDVSFEAEEGEFLGIIGDNGSGKSTLLKIIARILRPSQGSIEVAGRVTPFLELGVGFHSELTVRENIGVYGTIMGLTQREINDRMDEIIDFAGLQKFGNAKLKNLSSGMQVRLAFSTAVQTEPDILLVDEVLAVGDMDFQQKCFDIFNRYKKEGVTVLFVSHDLGSVRRFCDRTLLLRRGEQIALGDTGEILDRYIYGGGIPPEPKPAESHNDAAMAIDTAKVVECSGLQRIVEAVLSEPPQAEAAEGAQNPSGAGAPCIDAVQEPPIFEEDKFTEGLAKEAEGCDKVEARDECITTVVEPDAAQATVIELDKEPIEIEEESRHSMPQANEPSDAHNLAKTDQMGNVDDNSDEHGDALPSPADTSDGITKLAEPEDEILPAPDEIHEEIPTEHRSEVSNPAADVPGVENKDSVVPDAAVASEFIRTDSEEGHLDPSRIDAPHTETSQDLVVPEATTEETLRECAGGAKPHTPQDMCTGAEPTEAGTTSMPTGSQIIEPQDSTPTADTAHSETIEISGAAGCMEATPGLVDEPKEGNGSEPESDVVQGSEITLEGAHERAQEGTQIEPEPPAINQDPLAATRWGNGRVKITGVQFLDKFGAENIRFYSFDPMIIRIHYSSPSPVAEPVFGMALYTEQGDLLYGTNTDLKEIVVEKVAGEGYIDLMIERLPMLSGRFVLTVAVHSHDHKPYDWLNKQYSFEVIPKGRDAGIFEIPCKWAGQWQKW